MLYAKNDSLYDYNNINDFNLVKEYLDYNSSYKSETSIITYKSCLKVFYEFLISYSTNIDKDYLAKQIDRKTIEHFINYQADKKLGEDIIHCRVMVLKDYLKYLAKNKIISMQKFFDIFDDLKVPKRRIKNQLCIKSEEVIRFIEKLKNGRDSFSNRRNILMILLLSNTGIRRKEVAYINPSSINFEENTIVIYKTKGSKPRVIGFSNYVKDTLLNYLKERESVLKKYNKKSENLLIKKNGDDLSINSITKMMSKISKEYNFKITCHSLRRGFATDMAENKTDIYLLSKMLGHENINTTASRYIQVFSNTIKEAMNNHPFSKLHLENKLKNETGKEIMQNSINRDELILTINLLTQEMNNLSKSLQKNLQKSVSG